MLEKIANFSLFKPTPSELRQIISYHMMFGVRKLDDGSANDKSDNMSSDFDIMTNRKVHKTAAAE